MEAEKQNVTEIISKMRSRRKRDSDKKATLQIEQL